MNYRTLYTTVAYKVGVAKLNSALLASSEHPVVCFVRHLKTLSTVLKNNTSTLKVKQNDYLRNSKMTIKNWVSQAAELFIKPVDRVLTVFIYFFFFLSFFLITELKNRLAF